MAFKIITYHCDFCNYTKSQEFSTCPKCKKKQIIDCCNKCGKKIYKIKREAGGITMRLDKCGLCKKEAFIIPARDWLYMIGKTEEWD